MGTSGAWGGSGTQPWRRARQLLDQLPDPDPAAPPDSPHSPGAHPPPDSPTVEALLDAVAAGLTGDDPAAAADPANRPLPSLGRLVGSRPRHGSRGGTGTGGSGGATGGGGGGGRRQLARAAQRGGVAIGAAYALRRGDAAALAEVGLDLAQLQTLTPRAQRMALLDAILGQPDHPDDVAARHAADEQLREILTGAAPGDDPDPLDLLRGFVGKLIYRVAIVELVEQLDRGAADQVTALRKEQWIGEWIRARLRPERFGATGGIVTLIEFQRVAARLLATALLILRST